MHSSAAQCQIRISRAASYRPPPPTLPSPLLAPTRSAISPKLLGPSAARPFATSSRRLSFWASARRSSSLGCRTGAHRWLTLLFSKTKTKRPNEGCVWLGCNGKYYNGRLNEPPHKTICQVLLDSNSGARRATQDQTLCANSSYV